MLDWTCAQRSTPRRSPPRWWLDLTNAAPEARQTIREALTREPARASRFTGMRPYMRDQELKFLHAWLILVGVK